MKQYRIVHGDDAHELADVVNELIAQGWTPVGGVSVLSYTYPNERKGYDERETTWSQAMIGGE